MSKFIQTNRGEKSQNYQAKQITINNNSETKEYNIDLMFIWINGKLGNMSVDEAVQLTKIINPKVGVPTHYGMFESNTENPLKYTAKLDCGFVMEYNKEYDAKEVLKSV